MDKKVSFSLVLLLLFLNTHCQMKTIPEWTPEICHPSVKDNDFRIELVKDEIFTLEGNSASLPFGGSGGTWGDSRSVWTSQHGTPIGADITYFAPYEDTFYRLKVDFPVDFMKEATQTKKFGRVKDEALGMPEDKENSDNIDGFSSLIFGFAPQGMVVVWLDFSGITTELGRYQATPITDIKQRDEYGQYIFGKIKGHTNWRDGMKSYVADSKVTIKTCVLWDSYRQRFNWRPIIESENKELKSLMYDFYENFNGEREIMLKPELDDNPYKKRSVPKVLNFNWETGVNEKYEGEIKFNEAKAYELFRKIGPNTKIDMKIKVNKDNSSFSVYLNDQLLEVDSLKVYNSDLEFKDSYK